MKPRMLATFALTALTTTMTIHAGELSPDLLTQRMIQRRAVEAVIWGMAAVNTDLMREQALRKAKGAVNQVVYWSKPVDWKNQTLTPNPDTIYFMVFFDTKQAGPMVIEVPPADTGSLAANIVNVWQMAMEDAGPFGADQGKGGKYLILPPGYQGTPPAGYIVLRADTYTGYSLLRANIRSHAEADIAATVTYGKRIRVYPLSQADQPPPTIFTDARDVVFDSTIPYDLRFFQSLDHIVQSEPWLERDRVMIDQLRTLGIEKGKPFHPDAATGEILTAAAREARAVLAHDFETRLPPFWPGSRWFTPIMPDLARAQVDGFSEAGSYPVDSRGLAYTYAFVGVKRRGKAQYFLMSIKDRNGKDLDGSLTYRLTVPPNAPASQYWSATLYDRATHALIRDMPYPSRASHTAQPNADGSVDLYFGPKAPPGKAANWVPTRPGGRFEVLFRLYGPQPSLFEKTWKLPDIEAVERVG